MAFIEWQDSYSVDHPQLDQQHRTLVQMVNDLHAAMSAGQVQQALGGILDKLVGYTVQHFRTEEQLMAQAGYPYLESHRKLHADLTNKALEFQKSFQSGATAINARLASFLREWLTTHILQQDRQYAPFVGKRKTAASTRG